MVSGVAFAGWGRFNPHFRHVNNTDQNRVIAPGSQGGEEISPGQGSAPDQTINIAPSFSGQIRRLRLYNRYLRTSEVVGKCEPSSRFMLTRGSSRCDGSGVAVSAGKAGSSAMTGIMKGRHNNRAMARFFIEWFSSMVIQV